MPETYSLVDATLKVIQDRRSIREYSPEPVSDQDIDLNPRGGPPGALRGKCPAMAIRGRQGCRHAKKTGRPCRWGQRTQVHSRICHQ